MKHSIGRRVGTALAMIVGATIATTGVAPAAPAAAAPVDPVIVVGNTPAVTTWSSLFASPTDVVVDPAGNAYFTASAAAAPSNYEQRIWRATPAGQVSTLAVTPGKQPFELTAGGDGDVYYVVDGTRVERASASGTISHIAGTGTWGVGGEGDGVATAANLNLVVGLAPLPSGDLVILESGRFLRRVSGSTLSTIGSFTNASGCLGVPGPLAGAAVTYANDIAADAAGNLYLAVSCGFDSAQILKVAPDLQVTRVVGGGSNPVVDGALATSVQLTNVWQVEADASGVYFANGTQIVRVVGGQIEVVSGSAPAGDFVTGTPAAAVRAWSFAVEPAGSLLVTGQINYSPLGRLAAGTLTVLTPSGGTPADGTNVSNRPIPRMNGLALGADGDLIVSMGGTVPMIRSIGTDSVIDTIAGTGALGAPVAGPADQSPQSGVSHPTMGANGNLHFLSGGRVMTVSPSGQQTVGAASPMWPTSLTSSPDGDLYVVRNQTSPPSSTLTVIDRIDVDGAVSTVYQSTTSGFDNMSDLALSSDGSMVLAPGTGTQLRRIVDGTATFVEGPTDGLQTPAVAIDPSGAVFIAQWNGVFRIDPTGVTAQVGSVGGTDVVVATNGDVWVTTSSSIVRYPGLAASVDAYTPVALDDSVVVTKDESAALSVVANDTIGAGALGPPVVVAPPASGAARVEGSTIVYTPAAGFEGTDSLSYRVCSAVYGRGCDTATVSLNVAKRQAVLSAVDPARLFDTRIGEPSGAVVVPKSPIGGSTVLRVKVAGAAGVPASGVAAVSLNVTVAGPVGSGYLTVYPCGDIPLASTVNFVGGQVVPNAVLAPLSASGEVCFFSNVSAHVLADVNGWLATSSGFGAVPPKRLFDTRPAEPSGTVAVDKVKVGGDRILRVKVVGVSGVPSSGVGAVSLNVTVADPEAGGFVTVFPCGVRPLASNVNFVEGQVVPNAVIAPVSASGEVCFFSNVSTHLLADVNGWFGTDAGFTGLTPDRLFDTRPSEPAGRIAVDKVKVGGDRILRVKVVGVSGVPSSGVGAVSLNVTVADPEAGGFVTVFPCGVRPLASNVNFVEGQVVPNAVIAPVSASGEVCFFSNVSTHLLADVNGWFAAT